MKKKLLAITLAAMMALSLLPMGAAADEVVGDPPAEEPSAPATTLAVSVPLTVAAEAEEESQPAEPCSFTIRAGEVLELTVTNDTETSLEYTVKLADGEAVVAEGDPAIETCSDGVVTITSALTFTLDAGKSGVISVTGLAEAADDTETQEGDESQEEEAAAPRTSSITITATAAPASAEEEPDQNEPAGEAGESEEGQESSDSAASYSATVAITVNDENGASDTDAVYQLITDALAAGGEYLIVNTNDTNAAAFALQLTSKPGRLGTTDYDLDKTQVNLLPSCQNSIILNPDDSIIWTASSDSELLENGSRYLQAGTSISLVGRTFSLDTTPTTVFGLPNPVLEGANWTYSDCKLSTSLYYGAGVLSIPDWHDIYACYTDNSFDATNQESNIYLFKKADATGHAWGEGVVTAATCEEPGVITYTCADCGAIKTETIPAIGHLYGAPEWEWSDDFSTATTTFTCTHDKTHVETRTVNSVAGDSQLATASEDGWQEYTATVTIQLPFDIPFADDVSYSGPDEDGNYTFTDTVKQYIKAAKITFDPGKGTGAMDPAFCHPGTEYTLPDCTFTAPANQEFDKWQIGTGDTYKLSGDTYIVNADTTVTAIWKDVPSTDTGDGGGGGGGGSKPTPPPDPTNIDDEDVPLDGSPFDNCPKDATCPISKFTDASPTAWYHDGVHYVLDKGIMQGVGEDKFAPNAATTRAMIVTMLWRMEGSPVVNYAMSFTDVPSDIWYTESVRWAASNEIVKGYSDTAFGPMDDVTREQLAAILYRYAQFKDVDVSVGEDTNILSYDDALSISDWAMPAMQWACGSGIIKGKTESTLAPVANATRAEVATMLMRLCEDVMK